MVTLLKQILTRALARSRPANTPLEKLISCWSKSGRRMMPGAWEKEVQDFEAKYGVTLPRDFREYLACIGNSTVGQKDWGLSGGKDLYAFWALNEIKSVPEETDTRSVPESEDPSSYFIFADYCIWCWAYAICVGPNEPGKVIVVGALEPTVIANSFTEFIEAYMQDPNRGILEPLTVANLSPPVRAR